MAPLWSELPAKTLIATLLAGLAGAADYGLLSAPGWLVTLATVLAPIFVFVPLLLVYLVRSGGWRVALPVSRLLYWTEEGRAALGRLLAQAALQVGDPEGALQLSPQRDALLLTQAQLLKGDYEGVLAVELPPNGAGDNAHLVASARVEALLELGRMEEAKHELEALKTRFEAGPKGPLGHRAVVLAEARYRAFEGDFEGVQTLLSQPLVGVRPATLYRLLGVGAERAGQVNVAGKAYTAAYSSAAGRQREQLASDLYRLGVEPPAAATVVRRRTLATFVTAGVLAVAYLIQYFFDGARGNVVALGTLFQPSHLVAAFIEGYPTLPGAGAWWRYLSYAFLHANFVHLGFNLWVLLDIGRIYERRRAWGDLLAAFALGTAGGALLTTIFQAGQQLVLVGASGGILGVAGALLAEALTSRTAADRLLLRSLAQWMLIILLFSIAVQGVSLWGHVGGAVGGFVYGFVRARLPRAVGAPFAKVAGAASVLLLVAAVFSGVSLVLPLLP